MKDVYLFTLKQCTKGKGFFISAFVIPIVICLIGVGVLAYSASADNDSNGSDGTLEKLYITNESDITYMNFDYFGLSECIVGESVPKGEKKALDVIIKNADNAESEASYDINIKVPEWSELTDDDAEEISGYISDYVNKLKKVSVLAGEKGNAGKESELMMVLNPVNVEYVSEGDENANLGATLVYMLGPMLIVFILYFMCLSYGQSIGKSVISEKVSKLIETLLITVKPTELIAGKILAMATSAVIQMSMWIIGLVSGIGIGHMVSKAINPDYTNIVFEIIKIMQESNDNSAFTITAVVLSILTLFLGFLFMCVFAGLVSSPVSKAEELSSGFSIYQIVIVISFFVAYFLPMGGKLSPVVDKVIHVIPFTAAFLLPGDILVGKIGMASSLLYICILLVFTVIMALYTSKVYKDQIFYNGSEINVMQRLFKPMKKR